jgi:hypothetical protein
MEGWLHLWGPSHPWFLAQDILTKLVLPNLAFWGACTSIAMVTVGVSMLLGLVMAPVLLAAFVTFGLIFLIAAPVDPVLAAWMLALMVPIPCLLGAHSQWVLGVDWWTAPYKALKHAGLLKKAPSKKKILHAPKHISPLEGHRFTRMGPSKVLHDDELDNDPEDDLDTEMDWRKPSRGSRSSGATVTELKPTASQAKVNAMLERFTLPAEEDDNTDDDDFDDDWDDEDGA